ncbi:N-terminal acetyltransferase B complex catalytic subunit [Nematocida major]|uniref:N-terminal acetyltransferase B complex catalytic subunit n=1 Tax=Nematocida major TaxID=1912982 RepID=UPI0020087EBB|nr:N-terminal acetyltransferase B complex catalytic subunit [Nematocida major]KAH9387249.1 N-terminal acetyltransferase B complex catalytic subunit [Nematocida major]
MLSYREFSALEFLDPNLVNLDEKTVSFSMDFYFRYLMGHSRYCVSALSEGAVAGYIIGNSGKYRETETLYSHVTALSVAPAWRRFGVGRRLLQLYRMNAEMDCSEFTDLFVRASNEAAIHFYEKQGYIKHERIEEYYAEPVEDAYDMRLYKSALEGLNK